MSQAARLSLRLQKELKLLLTDPPPSASFPFLSPHSDLSSLSLIHAQIRGPEGSVYADGVFKIKIQIPERYPFHPPIVTFVTPIYHPNIDNGGRICLDILNLPPKGAWQPSLNISTVLTSIGLLLSEPNPDDGLMCEASREYKYNIQAFDQKARSMTEKYAKADASESISSSSSYQLSSDPCKVEGSESKNELQDEVKESAVVKKVGSTSRKLSLESSTLVQQRGNSLEKNEAAIPHLGIFNLEENIKVGGCREERRYTESKSNCEKLSGNKKYSVESHDQLHNHSGKESKMSYHHLSSNSHTAETAFCNPFEVSSNHKETTQNREIIDKNLKVPDGVQPLGSSHTKISGGYREKDPTNSQLLLLQPRLNAPKMVLEVQKTDQAELKSVKDSSGLKSDGSSDTKSRKLSVSSKKRSLGLKGPLQNMEKDENVFLGPLPRLQLSNPQKFSLKNGSSKKLSLGLPTPLREKNVDDHYLPQMKRSMDSLDATLVQVNYKQDVKQVEQDQHTTGEVDRQETEEPLPPAVDAMIVLDSEDSEEDDNKPARPTLLQGRKRLGNGKLKA